MESAGDCEGAVRRAARRIYERIQRIGIVARPPLIAQMSKSKVYSTSDFSMAFTMPTQ